MRRQELMDSVGDTLIQIEKGLLPMNFRGEKLREELAALSPEKRRKAMRYYRKLVKTALRKVHGRGTLKTDKNHALREYLHGLASDEYKRIVKRRVSKLNELCFVYFNGSVSDPGESEYK